MTSTATSETTAGPSFGEAFMVWLKIGCINFGGPAGQIALMHRVTVDEKKWVDEARFLHERRLRAGVVIHGVLVAEDEIRTGPKQPRNSQRPGERSDDLHGWLAANSVVVVLPMITAPASRSACRQLWRRPLAA